MPVNCSFDQLYRMYVGKNVLNFFRQDHGYKEGTYVKVWGGREDNEHLSDLLAVMDVAEDDFAESAVQGSCGAIPRLERSQTYSLALGPIRKLINGAGELKIFVSKSLNIMC